MKIVEWVDPYTNEALEETGKNYLIKIRNTQLLMVFQSLLKRIRTNHNMILKNVFLINGLKVNLVNLKNSLTMI